MLSVILILMTACAPKITTTADYDKEANFKSFQSFSFGEMEETLDPLFPMFDNELNRKRIREAIHQQMLAQGLMFQEDEPHVLVDYHVVIKDKAVVDSYHQTGKGFWNFVEVDVYDYTEGTLVVHLVHNKDQKLVWQGSATSVLRSNSKDPKARIDQAVASIFEKYPKFP